MAYYRNRTLRGIYQSLDFPLPSNSLAMAPAAVAVIEAVNNSKKKAGLSGAYGPPPVRWPGAYSRRSMPVLPEQASPRAATALASRPGMGAEIPSGTQVMEWLKNNPLLAGGIGIAAVLLLGMGRRGRR